MLSSDMTDKYYPDMNGDSLKLAMMMAPLMGAAVSCSSDRGQLKVTSNGEQPRNVIFILSDDHRYDYMGFMETVPGLQTPNLDYMAANGLTHWNLAASGR